MKKIYFAGSIRGGRQDVETYRKLINELSKHHIVLTEHLGSEELGELGEFEISDVEIFNRDLAWIREADVVIAEVTTPSLGVGYELCYAEFMRKKIICIYRQRTSRYLSAMVSGNRYVDIILYDDMEIIPRLLKEIDNL